MDEVNELDEEGSTGSRRPPGLIGAVDNVLRLLRLFEKNEILRVNQVAREMELSRSTVHRMLATLSHHGFVEQDELSRGYRPGPALIDLGLAVFRSIDIRSTVQIALTRLRDLTNESVHMVVRRDTQALFVDSVESRQMLRTGSRIGWTLPAHATAAGKVLLAALPEDELGALYPTGRLEAVTEHTVTTLKELRAQLAEVRKAGYAVNDGESEVDVSAVALAVRQKAGPPRVAIAITAPMSRAGESWAARTAEIAKTVIDDLEKQIR
ncbi:IclR family transcriptional regulator [Streptomyces sp. NPDC002143]